MLDRVGGDAVAAAGGDRPPSAELLPEPSLEAHSHDLITDMATVTMRPQPRGTASGFIGISSGPGPY